MLTLDPPPQIRDLLQARVNDWRGVVAPVAPQPPQLDGDVSLQIDLSVSNDIPESVAGNTVVFVIARDPAQPSPPIAVVRRQLSELPVQIEMTDRDAMLPGRLLSNFAEIEIVARLSMSGAPAERSGDWFGSAIVNLGDPQVVALKIDSLVP